MDDLISRQDAIDAVRKSYDEILDFKSNGHTIADSVEDIIEAVPSAQKWIPCSERPPEENEFYWVTIYSEEMQTAFCDKLFYGVPQLCENKKIGWYFMHDNGDAEQVFNVKAWMPLPEPRKGENDG